MDYLLKSGSDPNVSFSEDGSTPLILRTIGRHFDIDETMVGLMEARYYGCLVETALSWAAEQGNTKLPHCYEIRGLT